MDATAVPVGTFTETRDVPNETLPRPHLRACLNCDCEFYAFFSGEACVNCGSGSTSALASLFNPLTGSDR